MKLKNIFISLGLGLALSSCGFLEVDPQVICSDTFYNNEEELLYGLAGVYGAMGNESFYGNYYSLMLSNTDDLCYYNRSTTTNYTVTYTHDPSATEVYSAWTEIYEGIRNANAFMEAVEGSEFDSQGRYFNEARFLRAYYHFLLAQAWGDVPLKTSATRTPDDVMCASTPQFEVLSWAAAEMEACLASVTDNVAVAPSRITRNTVRGILARVYLFMAGESVVGGDKKDFYGRAMAQADSVISSGQHKLNPDYSQVFINMISDKYDTEYRESMWEVDFIGNRQSVSQWSNGRIGDLIGLQSSGSSGYENFLCNFSYGQYDGSLKLWDLYWTIDRTFEETSLPVITDKRQEWNMPPYNYAGNTKYSIDPSTQKSYYYEGAVSAQDNPVVAQAVRNSGKFRREVQYEGVMDSKRLYTGINFPLLRYSDVLLMYAEASLEYTGTPSQAAYDCVKAVRDRAGVKTEDFTKYDTDKFRQLVRNERGRELCFEATRKYDLIRWGVFVEEMNNYTYWTELKTEAGKLRWTTSKAGYAAAIGSAVQEKHVVLPIPAVELGVNNLLVQNQLW